MSTKTVIIAFGVILLVILTAFSWKAYQQDFWALRGNALINALQALPADTPLERKGFATLIHENYSETRRIAANWSGLYWGLTFFAAIASASAGLILKWETDGGNERRQRNWGALLAIIGALAVTISTSGDFQRKWQANRMAAAEIESIGYDFLADSSSNLTKFYSRLRDALNNRQLAIIGSRSKTSQGNSEKEQ